MAINLEYIVLDKTKSKPWVRPSDLYDAVRYAWKIAHGDMFPNVYELTEEEEFKRFTRLIDWDTHNPYLECLRHDTHHQPFYNGNHINREVKPLSGYKLTKGLTFNKVKEEIEKSMNKKTIKDVDRVLPTSVFEDFSITSSMDIL